MAQNSTDSLLKWVENALVHGGHTNQLNARDLVFARIKPKIIKLKPGRR